MMRFLLLLSILLFTGNPANAQSVRQFQRQGDREYQDAHYREAEEAYRQAAQKKQNDPIVRYNTGNAIYQQGNYAASENYFDQTAREAKDPAIRADAFHNLGNAYFKQQKFKEAVDAYQNSLRLRPGDADTKVNLQMARKKWQKQQQEQQQQEQQQNQPQDQPIDQQKQQPQQQNQAQQPQESQQNQQPEEQPSDGSMTREQARRVLETAVGPEDQKNARKYRELDPGKHKTRPAKDW